MSQYDIDKSYVSPYDRFLFEFDATHPKTTSQLREIEKHQKIAQKRDFPNAGTQSEIVWDKF